jgi:DNA-binding response OmpR family regulator
MMTRIFMVDDDVMTCVLVSRLLRDAGYDVRYGYDSGALFQAMVEWPPQLVVLDIHLAGEDGRSIARRLRSLSSIPILMLTGRTDLQTKVQSLDLGADDFIDKPFANQELVARVRALLRRAALPAYDSNSTAEQSKGMRLDNDRRTLTITGVGELTLTEAELRLLASLLTHAGAPLSREILCKSVLRRSWRPGERSLDLHISNLRNKLRNFAPRSLEIQSVRGVGYRLLVSCNA